LSFVGLEVAAIDFKAQVALSFETSVNFYPTNGTAFMKSARFIGQWSDYPFRRYVYVTYITDSL